MSNSNSSYKLNVKYGFPPKKDKVRDLFKNIVSETTSSEPKNKLPNTAAYLLCKLLETVLRENYGKIADFILINYNEDLKTRKVVVDFEPCQTVCNSKPFDEKKISLFMTKADEAIIDFISKLNNLDRYTRTDIFPDKKTVVAASKIDLLRLIVIKIIPSLPDRSFISTDNLEISCPIEFKDRSREFFLSAKKAHVKSVTQDAERDKSYMSKLLNVAFNMPFLTLEDYIMHANHVYMTVDEEHLEISQQVAKTEQAIVNEDRLSEWEVCYIHSEIRGSISLH